MLLIHYIKIGWRNVLKTKITSIINILGLSLSIGSGIVILYFLEFQYSMDDFHINRNSTYLVTSKFDRDGREQTWGVSPIIIGEMMLRDFQDVEKIARVASRSVEMHSGDKTLNELIFFTDKEFLEMFSFKFKLGENSISKKNGIVLSNRLSIKYFGNEVPIGREIELEHQGKKQLFIVTGVLEEFPNNSSIQFSALISFENLLFFDSSIDPFDWKDFITATFIQLKPESKIESIKNKISRYKTTQNKANVEWPIQDFDFQSLNTLSLNSSDINGNISGGYGDYKGRIVLLILGFLMLLLSCFNYANLSLVSGHRRIREIAIRKAAGSITNQLVFQFISENLVLTFIASLIGLGLAMFIFLPEFEKLFSIGMSVESFSVWLLVFYVMLFTLLTGILSGAYPAFYIASFSPAIILRGDAKFLNKNSISNLLLFVQFVLSGIVIFLSTLFVNNQNFLEGKDWGYNPNDVMVIYSNDSEKVGFIKNALENYPGIISATSSKDHVGFSRVKKYFKFGQRKYQISLLDVGRNYAETIGLRFKKGSFVENEIEDSSSGILVNESFVRNFELSNPVGSEIIVDTAKYTIIGVVEDFHYSSFDKKIEPTILRFRSITKDDHYLILRTKSSSYLPIAAHIEQIWKQNFSDEVFNIKMQNGLFDQYLQFTRGHTKIILFVSVISTLLSVLGLFGILYLNVISNMKQLGLRKILGANSFNLFVILNSKYIFTLCLSILISVPVSYLCGELIFKTFYYYHIDFHMVYFLIGIIVIFISTLTPMIYLINKVSRINAIDAVKGN